MTQEQRESQMGNGLQAAEALYSDTSLIQKIFKLQSEIGKISKDKENPYFKSNYTDINGILDEVRPLMKELGLVLLQPIRNGKVYSIIVDVESGKSEDSFMNLSDQKDPQKLGSEITYFRRYTLQSLLGLQQEDDDGNRASGKKNGSPKRSGTPPKNKDDDDKGWLNEGTKDWMNAEAKVKSGKIEPKDLRDFYKVSNANMEHFERLKQDGLADLDNKVYEGKSMAEMDNSDTPF